MILTELEVEEQILEHHGNMAAVARHFGVTRGAVWIFCRDHEYLREVFKDCRESMKDNAESSLYASLMAGHAWAIMFFLKCQAKDRGYVERQEMTGADGGPIATSLEANMTAALMLRSMLKDDCNRSDGNLPTLAITSQPGDGGFSGQADEPAAPSDDGPRAHEGVEHPEQQNGHHSTVPAWQESPVLSLLPGVGDTPMAGDPGSLSLL